MLTFLDAGRDGDHGDEQAEASVDPQEDLVFHAAVLLRVKHGHEDQAPGGDRIHDERHQGQRGVPQLVAGRACVPVSPDTGRRGERTLVSEATFPSGSAEAASPRPQRPCGAGGPSMSASVAEPDAG